MLVYQRVILSTFPRIKYLNEPWFFESVHFGAQYLGVLDMREMGVLCKNPDKQHVLVNTAATSPLPGWPRHAMTFDQWFAGLQVSVACSWIMVHMGHKVNTRNPATLVPRTLWLIAPNLFISGTLNGGGSLPNEKNNQQFPLRGRRGLVISCLRCCLGLRLGRKNGSLGP